MTAKTAKPYEDKICFVITPIGGDNTDIRREADGIIDEVLVPVLGDIFGFKVEVAHRTYSTGSITDRVIQSVVESELAICNLATLNPNVMYELALRHAVRKPVITIAPKGTILPFDINDDRVIFYENDIAGSYQLKKDLPLMVKAAMEEDISNNPVYRALRSEKLMQEVQAGGGADAALFDVVQNLSRKIDSMQFNSTSVGLTVATQKAQESYRQVAIYKPSLEALKDDEVNALKSIVLGLQDSVIKIPLSFALNEPRNGLFLTMSEVPGIAPHLYPALKTKIQVDVIARGYHST